MRALEWVERRHLAPQPVLLTYHASKQPALKAKDTASPLIPTLPEVLPGVKKAMTQVEFHCPPVQFGLLFKFRTEKTVRFSALLLLLKM